MRFALQTKKDQLLENQYFRNSLLAHKSCDKFSHISCDILSVHMLIKNQATSVLPV